MGREIRDLKEEDEEGALVAIECVDLQASSGGRDDWMITDHLAQKLTR